jgi:hypothetical protein
MTNAAGFDSRSQMRLKIVVIYPVLLSARNRTQYKRKPIIIKLPRCNFKTGVWSVKIQTQLRKRVVPQFICPAPRSHEKSSTSRLSLRKVGYHELSPASR